MPPYTIFYVKNTSNPFIYAGVFVELSLFQTLKFKIVRHFRLFYNDQKPLFLAFDYKQLFLFFKCDCDNYFIPLVFYLAC
jgi:hypothetical protein